MGGVARLMTMILHGIETRRLLRSLYARGDKYVQYRLGL